MFGKIVMDVPGEPFEDALDEAKDAKRRGTQDTDLDADDLARADRRVQGDLPRPHRRGLPAGPEGAAALAIEAVFRVVERQARDRLPPAEQDPRRPRHRRQRAGDGVRQPGDDSGTGVAFTRDPSTGEKVPTATTSPTRRAKTSWRASATRCRSPSSRSSTRRPTRAAARRDGHARGPLPRHVRHRVHDREGPSVHPADAHRQAHARSVSGSWPPRCSREGLIDEDEALLRVDADRLEELFKRRVDADGAVADRQGLNASPGAATGRSYSTPTRPSDGQGGRAR